MQELAQSIIEGKVSHPYGIGGYYSWKDWPKAAEYALESDDWSEFSAMIAREELYEQWQEAQALDVDFDIWAERIAA